MKKLISLLLAAVLCFSMLTVPASAAAPITISRTYRNGYTQVTLYCRRSTIYYTLDGSSPDKSDKKYSSAIKIKEPSRLRAVAYRDGKKVAVLNKDIDVRLKTPTAKLVSENSKKAVYQITAPKGAKVYITDDGSTPSKSNNVVSSSKSAFKLTVRKNGTYKLRAYKSGWTRSKTLKIKVDCFPEKETAKKQADKPEDTEDTEEAAELDDFEAEVLRLVNIERKKAGLSELGTNDKLSQAAQIRAGELKKKFDHTRPDGRSCFTVFSDVGLRVGASGENIAAGQRTPKEVVECWMNSPGHRKNILNSKYRYIGIGFSSGGGYGTYWVQLFTS